MKILRTIAVQFFIGANIATILLMWLCCGVTYIHPDSISQLSLIGLLFPFFLFADFLFIIFWIIFKAKYVWIPLIGILFCWNFVRDYIPVNVLFNLKDYDDAALRILSYNTRNYGGKEANREDGSNISQDFILQSDADIICLQESEYKKDFSKQMEGEGYESCHSKEFTIFSRFPILSYDTLATEGHRCHALQAFLAVGQDTIMLINQHLQSNKLSPELKQAYREAIQLHEKDSIKKEIIPIIRLLTVAAPIRAAQADSIAQIIESWLPRPVIVCGDFNDTPISYAHRILTRRLTSAHTQSGNGLGFTFHEKGFPVRIDHILFTGNVWKSHETHVNRSISYSDHYPIMTKLTKIEP